MTKSTQDAMLKQLKDPFDPKFLKWRVGQLTKDKTKATALAYLDAREVYKRLDDVCGLGGWSSKMIAIDKGFICELSILIDGQWVTKSDSADYTDIEAIKGGASSALKRAAAVWGIGRYLYYLPRVWIEIDEYKNLREIPELPDWAKPSHSLERWEDIAELELDASSGVDADEQQEIAALVIRNIDIIRNSKTLKELQEFAETLDANDYLVLSNEINAKTKELINGKATN
jgi:hypothetical protein